MLRILRFGEKLNQKDFLKILPPPSEFFFVFFEKNEKCLELFDQKTPPQAYVPENCRWCRWGARTPISANGKFHEQCIHS
jgi:hypothetical protein